MKRSNYTKKKKERYGLNSARKLEQNKHTNRPKKGYLNILKYIEQSSKTTRSKNPARPETGASRAHQKAARPDQGGSPSTQAHDGRSR